jgi:hypothetical protein
VVDCLEKAAFFNTFWRGLFHVWRNHLYREPERDDFLMSVVQDGTRLMLELVLKSHLQLPVSFQSQNPKVGDKYI